MPSPAGRRHPHMKRRRSGWWGQASLGPVGSFSEFLTCDVVLATPPKERRRSLREAARADLSVCGIEG